LSRSTLTYFKVPHSVPFLRKVIIAYYFPKPEAAALKITISPSLSFLLISKQSSTGLRLLAPSVAIDKEIVGMLVAGAIPY
jgi:hypothetical protein